MAAGEESARAGAPWPTVRDYEQEAIRQLRQRHHSKSSAHGKKRRFPPYGKILFECLLRGYRPRNSVFAVCGDPSWILAKQRLSLTAVLVLPIGDKPSDYFWPVHSLDAVVLPGEASDKYEIHSLAYELIQSGASPLVVVMDPQHRLGQGITTFRPRQN